MIPRVSWKVLGLSRLNRRTERNDQGDRGSSVGRRELVLFFFASSQESMGEFRLKSEEAAS
jgi:hypothetical protein